MSINPYDAEYYTVRGQLEAAQTKLQGLQEQLDAHGRTSQGFIEARIAEAGEAIFAHAQVVHRAQLTLQEETATAKALVKEFDNEKWNPLEWVRLNNVDRYRNSEKAMERVAAHTKALGPLQAKADKLEKKRKELRAQLAAFLAFESQLKATRAAVASLQEEVAPLAEQFAKISDLRSSLDEELREPLADIAKYEKEVRELKEAISQATDLQARLDRAGNDRREKWLVHNTCETLFEGVSHPSSVLSSKRKHLEATERKLRKNQKHAQEIVKRHTRVIDAIVIDGCNMCFIDKKYIGLEPVLNTAEHLATKYKVTVIFDASIREMAGMESEDIKALFKGPSVVHVMATGGKADEIVLKEASAPNTYVISNDQFVEFRTMPAVREDRLMKHDILNGKVYVQRLGLEIAC